MTNSLGWLVTAVTGIVIIAATTTNALPFQTEADGKLTLDFDDVVPSSFYFPGFNGSWLTDKQIIYRHLGDMYTFDMDSLESEKFLDIAVLVCRFF